MTPFYWFSLGILVAVLALVLGYSVGWIQTEMKRRKEVMPQSGLYQVKDDNYKQPEATMTTSMTTEELDRESAEKKIKKGEKDKSFFSIFKDLSCLPQYRSIASAFCPKLEMYKVWN